jgi:di/tricarboxylate transporter
MSEKVVKAKLSGYDKYINWKVFSIPLALLLILIIIPTPSSMLDVGVEYSMGPKYAREFFAQELFQQPVNELEQWQVQWMVYCTPFLLYLIPITWIVLNWRFKPEQRSLANAMALVKSEVNKVGGGWTRAQIISLAIFLVMLFTWITENNLIVQWTGIRFGIEVLAVMGGIAYILADVVNCNEAIMLTLFQTK